MQFNSSGPAALAVTLHWPRGPNIITPGGPNVTHGPEFDTCVSKPLGISLPPYFTWDSDTNVPFFCLTTVQRSYDPWWTLTPELCSQYFGPARFIFLSDKYRYGKLVAQTCPREYSLGFEVLLPSEWRGTHSAERESSMFWCCASFWRRASRLTSFLFFTDTSWAMLTGAQDTELSRAVYSRLQDRRAAERPLKMFK